MDWISMPWWSHVNILNVSPSVPRTWSQTHRNPWIHSISPLGRYHQAGLPCHSIEINGAAWDVRCVGLVPSTDWNTGSAVIVPHVFAPSDVLLHLLHLLCVPGWMASTLWPSTSCWIMGSTGRKWESREGGDGQWTARLLWVCIWRLELLSGSLSIQPPSQRPGKHSGYLSITSPRGLCYPSLSSSF